VRLSVFLIVLAALGQDFEKGAQVFRQTCAQGYCHGSGGTQGRAPKLIGRNYDGVAALKIIRDGVPNTGMPGFGQRLSAADLDAVTAYVVRVSGGDVSTLTASASVGATTMPAEAQKGKTLFFDALRGVNRCGTCHAMEGQGTAVGPNLATAAHGVDAIRNGKPATIRQAVAGTERMPALVVEQAADSVRFYDLTSIPPVLRTAAKGSVTFQDGAGWRHAEVVKGYSAAELAAISAYLTWAAK
jgi:mono/diheme cytochrome c family protein